MATRTRSTTAVPPEGPEEPGGPVALTTRAPAGALGELAPLAARARALALEAQAPHTRELYRAAWRRFVAWTTSLPPSPETDPGPPSAPELVALYLTARAEAGRSVATIELDLAAIAAAHQAAGQACPRRHPGVLRVLAGIRRTLGVAQRRAAPLLPEQLRQALRATPGERLELLALRDRALLLLGFAGAFRRSELVALEVRDLAFDTEGVTIMIRRSKTDQEGEGVRFGVPRSAEEALCPVRALRAWLGAAKITEGRVFAVSDQTVSRVVKRAAARAGLDPALYSGHSLRAGLATAAAVAGKDLASIMRQGRWRKADTVIGYIRQADLYADNAADGLFQDDGTPPSSCDAPGGAAAEGAESKGDRNTQGKQDRTPPLS